MKNERDETQGQAQSDVVPNLPGTLDPMADLDRLIKTPQLPSGLDLGKGIPQELTLRDRLDQLVTEDPERFNEETVGRVRKLVDFELENPDKARRLSMLEDITDFVLYREIHPEWEGMSTSALQHDKVSRGASFYQTCSTWIKQNAETDEERTKMLHEIFPSKKLDWSSYISIDQWREYYQKHPEWRDLTVRDKNSGFSAFYASFTNWVEKQGIITKEDGRVFRKLLEGTDKNFGILRTFEDWKNDYSAHPEWQDFSLVQLSRDKGTGGKRFYDSFLRWAIKKGIDINQRKLLTREMVQKHTLTWSHLIQLQDWLNEYNNHPEWKTITTGELAHSHQSESSAFYASFISWAKRTSVNENERRGLIRKLFPNIEFKNKDYIFELQSKLSEIADGETIKAINFKKVVGLFGASSALDILYRSNPEFGEIPVEEAKSMLANYLGDFLVARHGFNVDDIDKGVEFLSEPNFKEALVEVVKNDIIQFYISKKREGSKQGDQEIVWEYINNLLAKSQELGNTDLSEVVEEIFNYYHSLFTEYKKPEMFVEQISAGREFPDFYQLLNVKEIADKKRMLIADRMGLGKSASVIAAKEILGVRSALIVAPANVIELGTWQDYLSDKVSEKGEQIGYYKENEAPKVLIIKDSESLKEADTSSYDFILVSHEKLTERYIEGLEKIDYGMLVVDEFHELKNIKEGVWARNIIRLASKVDEGDKYLALLSGTPAPNKVRDIAIALKLLYPEKFKDIDNPHLVNQIINGDLLDLRSLLVPRMQIKELEGVVELPPLTEQIVEVEITPFEREIYEVLLEEDELTASEKIMTLRRFLLNPELLDPTPGIPNSKAKAVGEYLHKVFQNNNKVVMFVNGYIEGVIRGEHPVHSQFVLPSEVKINVIHGGNKKERKTIQNDFQETSGKRLLVVSGDTAGLGVDFSEGEQIVEYNSPWSKDYEEQQVARVYRPPRKAPLTYTNFVARGTIEEGIQRYAEAKKKAINKLLKGIPISQLERGLLRKDEQRKDSNLEVNPELARYYISSWEATMRRLSQMYQIGEKQMLEFVSEHGGEYARGYTDIGARSYQANAARVCGTIINALVKETGQGSSEIKILDVASGPEMLRSHIKDEYQDKVVSTDINLHHFVGGEGDRVTASYKHLPFESSSFDYANLSLALHYARLIPSQGEFETLEVLQEVNRILKTGGKVVINNSYSRDFKNDSGFSEALLKLGFKKMEEYSGEVVSGTSYKSNVITLEKTEDVFSDVKEIANDMSREEINTLKIKKSKGSLRDSRKVVREVVLAGKKIEIQLNNTDTHIIEEEEIIFQEGSRLKEKYDGIKDIPREIVLQNNFIRIFNGKRYVLFKKLESANGVVIVR